MMKENSTDHAYCMTTSNIRGNIRAKLLLQIHQFKIEEFNYHVAGRVIWYTKRSIYLEIEYSLHLINDKYDILECFSECIRNMTEKRPEN